jgi:hypothetical protein
MIQRITSTALCTLLLFGCDELGSNTGVDEPGGTGGTTTRPMADCVKDPAGLGDEFIVGTIEGRVCAAPMKRMFVGNLGFEIEAETQEQGASGRPWLNWEIFVPNVVGTHRCGPWEGPADVRKVAVDVDEDHLNGKWMGGRALEDEPCIIEVTRAAASIGDVFEGTFSATVTNRVGWEYTITDGAFRGIRAN